MRNKNKFLYQISTLFLFLAGGLANAQDPIFDYIDISNTNEFIGCTPQTMVLKESYPAEFTYWPDSSINRDYYQEKFTIILERLYQNLADVYDFFIFSLQASPLKGGSFSIFANTDVEGIGYNYDDPFTYTKNLKSYVTMDNYPIYNYIDPFGTEPIYTLELLKGLRVQTSVHEIGHHWCCGLVGFYSDADKKLSGGHWPSFVNLFNNDTTLTDHMGGEHWVNIDNKWKCADKNNAGVDLIFSDLSLYLMGLIGPEKVNPIYVYQFDSTQVPANVNSVGPSCFDTLDFTGTRTLTIDSIIAYNGERIPNWQDSPKDFRVGNIIIVPFGETLDLNFVRLVNEIKSDVPELWFGSTDSLSTVFYDCPDTNWAGTSEPQEFRSKSPITVFTSGQQIQLGIILESSGEVEIEMFSFNGKKIFSNLRLELSQGYSLVDVNEYISEDIEGGGYLISAKAGGRAFIKKFVLM